MIWYCDCQDPARSALVHSGVSALLSTPVDSVPDRLLRGIVSRHNVSLVDSRSLFDWPVSSDQSLSPLRPMSRPLSHVRVWLGPGEPHNVIYLGSGAVSHQCFQFSSGLWYVTEKFDTKSTCLTYEFKTDNLGFKSIEQVERMITTGRVR